MPYPHSEEDEEVYKWFDVVAAVIIGVIIFIIIKKIGLI